MNNEQPHRMTFYATPADQETLQRIRKRRAHYSFNFAVREGLRLLLRELKAADTAPVAPSKRYVEYQVSKE